MRVKATILKIFDLPIHKRRKEALFSLAESLLSGSKLNVTALGRGLSGEGSQKHKIKRSDRLLSNSKLHAERDLFYEQSAKLLVGNKKRPVIIVDWSNFDSRDHLFILRASLAADGRALTLYENVYSRYAHPKDQGEFLLKLKNMLPHEARPIVVTDAGFRIPWFENINELGWDYVGRIRGQVKIKGKDWLRSTVFGERATRRAKCYPSILIGKGKSFMCNLVLLRNKNKGRSKITKSGNICSSKVSKAYSRAVNEPWVLATSLCATKANKVVKLYQSRMQIEESFRDLKTGDGLGGSRTHIVQRARTLLLVSHLAQLVFWLIGLALVKAKRHRRYQANSLKSRVLSVVFVGRMFCRESHRKMESINLNLAFAELYRITNYEQYS